MARTPKQKPEEATTTMDPVDVAPCVATHSSSAEVFGVLIELLRKAQVDDDRINLAMSHFLQERNKVTGTTATLGACRYDGHCCILTWQQCSCFTDDPNDWEAGGTCD